MSYNIEGWVETTYFVDEEQNEDYAWQGLINLPPLIWSYDAISEQLFGLSKRCSSGEKVVQSLAARRGWPANPSPQLAAEIEHIRKFEAQHGEGNVGGYTHAKWSEIKTAKFEPADFEESDWKTVWNFLEYLEKHEIYSADQIRIVAWFVW